MDNLSRLARSLNLNSRHFYMWSYKKRVEYNRIKPTLDDLKKLTNKNQINHFYDEILILIY